MKHQMELCFVPYFASTSIKVGQIITLSTFEKRNVKSLPLNVFVHVNSSI